MNFLFALQISKEISFQVDMRIKHRNTGTWLYMKKGILKDYIKIKKEMLSDKASV